MTVTSLINFCPLNEINFQWHQNNDSGTPSPGWGRVGEGAAGYQAQIISSQDYYPFGMLMPGRMNSTDAYRWGFNGKEKDNEWTGTSGATYDYGFRIYDSRIGRWSAVDPFRRKHTSMTPYNFGSNNPIYCLDPDGRDIEPYSKQWGWGWFSWITYPHFTGGFTGTHGEIFHKIKTTMMNSSEIYNKVYSQLENSSSTFRFTETDITQGGVIGGMSKKDPEASGSFDPDHTGNKEDPYIINFNYEYLKGIEGYNEMV